MIRSAYNTMPHQLEKGDQLAKVIVAVVGEANDWAAYVIEVGPNGEMPSVEEVAANGDKIDRALAEMLFPVCVRAHLEWRD